MSEPLLQLGYGIRVVARTWVQNLEGDGQMITLHLPNVAFDIRQHRGR